MVIEDVHGCLERERNLVVISEPELLDDDPLGVLFSLRLASFRSQFAEIPSLSLGWSRKRERIIIRITQSLRPKPTHRLTSRICRFLYFYSCLTSFFPPALAQDLQQLWNC